MLARLGDEKDKFGIKRKQVRASAKKPCSSEESRIRSIVKISIRRIARRTPRKGRGRLVKLSISRWGGAVGENDSTSSAQNQ